MTNVTISATVTLVAGSGMEAYNASFTVPAQSSQSTGPIYVPDYEYNATVTASTGRAAAELLRTTQCPHATPVRIFDDRIEIELPPPPPSGGP